MGGYKNEEVDALIDEALAMSRDDPAFCDTVRQAEDLFLADTMLIPLVRKSRCPVAQIERRDSALCEEPRLLALFLLPHLGRPVGDD